MNTQTDRPSDAIDAAKPAQVVDTQNHAPTDRAIALATDWARTNAGEHAAVIENALAAYDPERAGARTVAKPVQAPVDNTAVGLYDKFRVERRDGSSAQGGKHHGCEHFVLDMTHDPFAMPAIHAYAGACSEKYPLLARDLRAKYGDAPQAPERRPITDEDVDVAAKAVADVIGHGMREKCYGMARAALEAVYPHGVPTCLDCAYNPGLCDTHDAQPAPHAAAGEPVGRVIAADKSGVSSCAVLTRPLPHDTQLYLRPASAASEADARLADTQRAIIEAAEARGYARAKVEGEANARDAAKFQWGVEHARWIRHEHEAYVEIPVARDADISCTATRIAAIDAAIAAQLRKGG